MTFDMTSVTLLIDLRRMKLVFHDHLMCIMQLKIFLLFHTIFNHQYSALMLTPRLNPLK